MSTLSVSHCTADDGGGPQALQPGIALKSGLSKPVHFL